MSFGIKVMMGLLALGMAGLFVVKKPDGTPWLNIKDFLPDQSSITEISQTANKALKNAESSIGHPDSNKISTAGKIYRWKDQQGNWQFSDTPPENLPAETMQVSGNLNRDLAEPATVNKEKPEATSPSSTAVPSTSPLSAFSPEKVQKLMEDTEKVKSLMENREKHLNQQTP